MMWINVYIWKVLIMWILEIVQDRCVLRWRWWKGRRRALLWWRRRRKKGGAVLVGQRKRWVTYVEADSDVGLESGGRWRWSGGVLCAKCELHCMAISLLQWVVWQLQWRRRATNLVDMLLSLKDRKIYGSWLAQYFTIYIFSLFFPFS